MPGAWGGARFEKTSAGAAKGHEQPQKPACLTCVKEALPGASDIYRSGSAFLF
jgi:hypothetical protein